MKVSADTGLKGAALLAAAGVTLADAQWLFAAQRAGGPVMDRPRHASIHRKVNDFLAAQQSAPAKLRRYG